jgi:hypothetical protein
MPDLGMRYSSTHYHPDLRSLVIHVTVDDPPCDVFFSRRQEENSRSGKT